jgi:hypothetical protein
MCSTGLKDKIALKRAVRRVSLGSLLAFFWLLAGQVAALAACAPGLQAEPALPPVGFSNLTRSDSPIALAVWIGEGEALAWPASRGAKISGEAGATMGGVTDCQIALPDGYHAALRFAYPNERLRRIGFGVCQTEGGLCEWVEIFRP